MMRSLVGAALGAAILVVGCIEGSLQGSGGESALDAGTAGDARAMVPPTGDGGPVTEAGDGPIDERMPPGTVVIQTSLGEITLALDSQRAPNTVANFMAYVDEGFFDGDDGMGATTFHRVISGFMIQGGGVKVDGILKPTRAPIAHEGNIGIANARGTVAMARTVEADSATSQFFINHADNAALNFVSPEQPGYVAFGRVTAGMDTVDAIAAVATNEMDVPMMPVLIEDVRRGP